MRVIKIKTFSKLKVYYIFIACIKGHVKVVEVFLNNNIKFSNKDICRALEIGNL